MTTLVNQMQSGVGQLLFSDTPVGKWNISILSAPDDQYGRGNRGQTLDHRTVYATALSEEGREGEILSNVVD